jgi:hypothetical protein
MIECCLKNKTFSEDLKKKTIEYINEIKRF